MVAAIKGDLGVVTLLLGRGANIEAADKVKSDNNEYANLFLID